ncbi:MAG: hypothetical protein KKE62_10560 [Proteobacteria bacterium]|nr:hypothetical protein [Pseudomonadota bacterium]MBU1386657.1 hypothetical protein [Pseudomonadota bacterium]MBU1543268.1 hypothetical protein [Pseudomonadota bacterium]MBU2482180.1 hypothetical protein [Pseudomonadota bacterium]
MKRFLFLVRTVFVIGIFFVTGHVFASPDLGNYRDIDGVRVYTDHKKKDIFYITPSPPALAVQSDRLPDASLKIYRYLGRKGTGDSGKFWVRGLLTIGIQREREKEQLNTIKKAISKADKIQHPKLRSMPVSGTTGRLVFADTDVKWSQGSRWSGKKISLSLDETMSQILWDAVAAGQTLISIEMEEMLPGVRKNKDGQWEDAQIPFGSTLPVTLDMKAYPSLFSKTDLGGNMARGYTGIDVFCFDFLENLDADLYSKVVEIAIPTPGEPLIQTVTFRQDSEYRTRVAFKLAKDMDMPYKVRITRVLLDGSSQAGPWMDRRGEALLDVTAYEKSDIDLKNEKNQDLDE